MWKLSFTVESLESNHTRQTKKEAAVHGIPSHCKGLKEGLA
jgi:hypothetical protein